MISRWLPISTICGLCLAPWSPACAASAPPPVLTLAEAQRTALDNIPDLRAAHFDYLAASEAIKVAHAAYEPQAYGQAVQAFAGPGTRLSAYNLLTNPTVLQRTAIGVGVNQYISDFGRTTSLVQAAEADLRFQAARTVQTRDLVLLEVTQSYFEVLRADSLVTVAEQTVRERAGLFRQVQALQRAGLRSILDVSIAQRDLATAHQELLFSQQRRKDSESNLSAALGYNELHVFTLNDIGHLPGTPTLTPLIDAALHNSPELAATQAQGQAANLRAIAVSKETYPTLNAYGFFGATPIRAANQAIGSSYAAGGVTLNIPLFTGGSLAAQKREAQDAANSIAELLVGQEDRLLRDVRNAYSTVTTARGNIGLSEQILTTASEALRFTNDRYRIGLASISDVSQAQILEDQAAIARTNATYDYIVQAASLEYVTGLMIGTDLFPGASAPSGSVAPSPGSSPPEPEPTSAGKHKRHRKILGVPLPL